MNRKIKYRAWLKEEKKMVNVFFDVSNRKMDWLSSFL